MSRPLREARIDLGAHRGQHRGAARASSPRPRPWSWSRRTPTATARSRRRSRLSTRERSGWASSTYRRRSRCATRVSRRRCWPGCTATTPDFQAAVDANVDLGISTPSGLERAAETTGRAAIQIKVDTGLSRNGIEERETVSLFQRAAQLRAGRRGAGAGCLESPRERGRDRGSRTASPLRVRDRRGAGCGASPRPAAPRRDRGGAHVTGVAVRPWCASALASTGSRRSRAGRRQTSGCAPPCSCPPKSSR